MKKTNIVLLLFLIVSLRPSPQARDSMRFTLVEAINHAVVNNPQLKSTSLNEEINRFETKEIRLSALQQLRSSETATDNFLQSMQLLPGERRSPIGIPKPDASNANCGTQHDAHQRAVQATHRANSITR